MKPEASLTFLLHGEPVSLNVENPTGPCQSEPAAALQKGESEVTMQMGRGRGGKLGEKESQKMKGVSANGV